MTERTPWPRLVALAQGFCLPPSDFWRLSVREWRALVQQEQQKLSRAALEAMMQSFPDQER
jgi:uncharacterized phage protein (TIGR02216 family)